MLGVARSEALALRHCSSSLPRAVAVRGGHSTAYARSQHAIASFSALVRDWPVTSTLAFASMRGATGDVAAQNIERRARRYWVASADRLAADAHVQHVDQHRSADHRLESTSTSCSCRGGSHRRVAGRFVWRNPLLASAFDNFLVTPLLYFPCFYIFKDCLMPRPRARERRHPDGERRDLRAQALRGGRARATRGDLGVLGARALRRRHRPAGGVLCVRCRATGYVSLASFTTQKLATRREAPAGA